MTKQLSKTDASAPELIRPEEGETAARVLILGGVEPPAGDVRFGEALRPLLSAQQRIVAALHGEDASAAAWAAQAGIGILALAGMRGEAEIGLPQGVAAIGAGGTEALATRPQILCVNGVRLGFLSFAEQAAGEAAGRADILGLAVYDRVRMLLSQCDHVLVLVRAGLDEGELPLPEWRARYRRFIDAGASVVADTGAAKGWEAYQSGLVFYGLGAPNGADSLGLFLTLRPNGRLDYEVRALSGAGGAIDLSANDAFRARIDAQNALLTDGAAYARAADAMCLALYEKNESQQKRGLFGAFSPRIDAEERLCALLGSESRRRMALRALRLKRAAQQGKRDRTKKA